MLRASAGPAFYPEMRLELRMVFVNRRDGCIACANPESVRSAAQLDRPARRAWTWCALADLGARHPCPGSPLASRQRHVTMESTSQGGTGPAMPVGNTMRAAPAAPAGGPVKPLAEPVAAAEVTKMPLPLRECPARYTEEARSAAVEGVVVLAAVIDEHGRAREITVVAGLPHGLTQSAIAELMRCPFSPGERSGQAVPVRLREIKFRFVMGEAQ
jgi:hypothetical protein